MPGMLSSLFDGGDAESQSSSQEVAADGGADLALSPSVTVESGGSYQEMDGSTTEWSNTTEVGADVNASAALATTTTLTGEATDFDQ